MRFQASPTISHQDSQILLHWVYDTDNNHIQIIQPLYSSRMKDPNNPLKLTFSCEKKTIYQQTIPDPRQQSASQNYLELCQKLKLDFCNMLNDVEPILPQTSSISDQEMEQIQKYRSQLF